MLFLKLAVRAWRWAPFSQLASTAMVSVLLFLMGFLFWVEQGLKPVINRLKNEQVVTLFLDPGLNAESEAQVVKAATQRLEDKLGVSQSSVSLKVVSQTEFLDDLKTHYAELAQELATLGTEITQVVPRYVSLTGIFRGDLGQLLKGIPGVERIESSQDRFQNIIQAFVTLRWVSRVLIFGIALALFTGLFHLCKTNGYLQSQAIELLRLWGATPLELKLPGVLAGAGIGFLGGALSAVLFVGLGKTLTLQIKALSPLLQTWTAPSPLLLVGLLIVGTLLGSISGLISVGTNARARKGYA